MASLPGSVALNATAKFSVIDPAALKVDHVSAPKRAREGNRRAIKSSGGAVSREGVHIGGAFAPERNAAFLLERLQKFEEVKTRRAEEAAARPRQPIVVRLPDGREVEGVSHETTPLDVAINNISPEFAKNVVVAKVIYDDASIKGGLVVCDVVDEEEEGDDEEDLWDATRPLLGSCSLTLLRFDDPGAKTVFWHSSSHVLGSALEREFGARLTVGPPLENGFYYDCFMGEATISDTDFKPLEGQIKKITEKEKQAFERVEVTKDELLEMFAYNPFKMDLIRNKVPAGERTTVYRNGDFVDLCRGPHVPNTRFIRASKILSHSATNWLGNVNNDSLQRVYAVSFPDKGRLKKHLDFLQKAKERDHRLLGNKQDLWFIHEMSPGSTFFTKYGARIYNTLVAFIRKEYWKRGYDEVVTPNLFNSKLWETSGHWQHYKDNMFHFDCEGITFGVKPMNCPGHCLMFGARLRSYRDLPIRMADFGVLHRNEVSGSLSGLTRVRRFQQDDAHIFCRRDQMKDEVLRALDFMRHVYTIFGMTYRLELSTKPKKALGEPELWTEAEGQLGEALDEFVGSGKWFINAGDGAFYGPKIDIKVFDALERMHQCATIQLDFQQPLRFDLKYKTPENDMQHPVIVHRAMLGSVERCLAVLTEHWGGKWPFWISPRQVCVIPISPDNSAYAEEVGQRLHDAGFYVDVDLTSDRFQKKLRTAQLAQYNYQLMLGAEEAQKGTVNVRSRDNERIGEMALDDFIDIVRVMRDEYVDVWPGRENVDGDGVNGPEGAAEGEKGSAAAATAAE